jgi:hypothetical protein
MKWMKANLGHNEITVVIKKDNQDEDLAVMRYMARRPAKKVISNN